MVSLGPPGVVETVAARCVVVLAPHFDDEVLGCGALVAQCAAAGARVEVVFLTDGSGGQEGPPPEAAEGDAAARAAYAQRRLSEAERAAEVLGVSECHFLNHPDGELQQRRPELANRIEELLVELTPDLLLVPSPLEASADHRAAFAALHGVLHADRGRLNDDLRVLAYEVNHPLYPNLLVDAGDQLAVIERAMQEYASQQERHDYLAAALGLRSFRTHSLPANIRAAEGYFRLGLEQFRTNTLSRTIELMGGRPEVVEITDGPTVSVVVRTMNRPQLLGEALASLAASSYRRLEVILVNDGGEPPALPQGFPFPLELVDLQPGRGRAGAAQAGIDRASGDYLSFLDDDDLAFPEHYATLVGALGAGVRVVYGDAAVGVYELGSRGWQEVERRLPYSRDFDSRLLLVDNYIPFNTLLIERALCEKVGALDATFDSFEDWDWLIRLSELTTFHHLPVATCEYRHFRGSSHHALGAEAQGVAEMSSAKARVLAKHASRLTPEVLADAIMGLRAETVQSLEQSRTAWRENLDLRDEVAGSHARERDLATRYHAMNGELVGLRNELVGLQSELSSLRAEGERRQSELARLYAEEKVLRGVAADHEQHLARTYAEIERLNGLISSMEQSRVWRLGQLLGRGR